MSYLDASQITEPTTVTIRELRLEMVDGFERVVIYCDEFAEGVVAHDEDLVELHSLLGKHPIVDAYLFGRGRSGHA